jgi:hypothetical protein
MLLSFLEVVAGCAAGWCQVFTLILYPTLTRYLFLLSPSLISAKNGTGFFTA